MRYVLLAVAILLIPACGSTKHKLRDIDAEFGPRVGIDKREDIAGILGFPSEKGTVGDSEIWVYRSGQVGSARGVVGGSNVYVRADDLILTFDKDGVLKSYKANVNKVK